MTKQRSRLDYRMNCMVSLGGLTLFFLLTFSWPLVPSHVQLYHSHDADVSLGCNATKFDWCDSLSAVNGYVYYVAYIILIGVSFPNLNIALTTLLSRILGPRRQVSARNSPVIHSGGLRDWKRCLPSLDPPPSMGHYHKKPGTFLMAKKLKLPACARIINAISARTRIKRLHFDATPFLV